MDAQTINDMLELEYFTAVKNRGPARFRATELRYAVPRFPNVIRNTLDRLVRQGLLKTETVQTRHLRASSYGPGSGKGKMTTTGAKYYWLVNAAEAAPTDNIAQ